jgi:pimeloyl-ACP methyl ester carboxylesterase
MIVSKKLVLVILAIALVQFISAQSNNSNPFDTTMYGRNANVGRYVKTRGFNMYYETYGTGEPLLIIHGNGGSISDFLYQIPFFSKSYKVILADSRAQGKSTDTGDSLSYEMMSDDLNALLDTLGLDSCFVIGWSDGGINGLLLAMRNPKKVKKLAVTGANLWPDTSAVDPFIYKAVMKDIDAAKKKTQTPKIRNDLKLMHLLVYVPHITIEQISKIQCPTLVIGGDHDILLPKHTLLIAESIPKSYLWILPNSGHSTPVFYKDQFNEVVMEFFRKPYRKIEGWERGN